MIPGSAIIDDPPAEHSDRSYMHILIALLPSLLWGAMALLNAAFPAEPRRQNTFVIAGGGAASLLTSPLTGATWSLHSLAWGLLSGLLWSIGIILLLKGFQTWGASRTMPLTTALQLALNGLIGVVLLGEWRAPGAMALGMGAVALVIAGGTAGTWQEGDGVGPSPRMRRIGALMTVCSAVFLGIYPGLLRLTDVSSADAAGPMGIGALIGAVIASRVLPRKGPLRGEGAIPAVLSGVAWALGNLALLHSTATVGVAAGFTFSQLGFVIAALGSIFLLKEPRTRKEIIVVFVGIAAALAGVVLMGMASAR